MDATIQHEEREMLPPASDPAWVAEAEKVVQYVRGLGRAISGTALKGYIDGHSRLPSVELLAWIEGRGWLKTGVIGGEKVYSMTAVASKAPPPAEAFRSQMAATMEPKPELKARPGQYTTKPLKPKTIAQPKAAPPVPPVKKEPETKEPEKMTKANDGDYVATVEAAKILGVHKVSVSVMRRRGDLKGRPIEGGAGFEYKRIDVEALRDQRAAGKGAPAQSPKHRKKATPVKAPKTARKPKAEPDEKQEAVEPAEDDIRAMFRLLVECVRRQLMTAQEALEKAAAKLGVEL